MLGHLREVTPLPTVLSWTVKAHRPASNPDPAPQVSPLLGGDNDPGTVAQPHPAAPAQEEAVGELLTRQGNSLLLQRHSLGWAHPTGGSHTLMASSTYRAASGVGVLSSMAQ